MLSRAGFSALCVALSIFLAGCIAIRPNPERLKRDTLIYAPAKVCRSPNLTMEIRVRAPLINPEEDIWTKDIQYIFHLRWKKRVITLVRYHTVEIDPKTGHPIPRTFSEFPESVIIGPDLEFVKKLPDIRKILKSIISSRPVFIWEVKALNEAFSNSYYDLVEKCLYNAP